MIEIENVRFRNFLSYGDSDTSIRLDNLGSCLITGENGAGKSTISNAILWCLFGRTMHSAAPGDKVVNFFVGKDCFVELNFKNGDKLTRTRKSDKHNDLLLVKDGQDVSLGTTKMQQANLNKMLDLDWDIFCGSTFSTQFGKSWMEMGDTKRKQALEREFHMDKIVLYATIAKESKKKLEEKQESLRTAINHKRLLIDNLSTEIEQLKKSSETFESDKANRIKSATETLNDMIESRDSIDTYDIKSLQSKWDSINKVADKLSKKRPDVVKLESESRRISNDIAYQKENKDGKVCSECEQTIPHDHVKDKIKDPAEAIKSLNDKLQSIDSDIKSKKDELSRIEKIIEENKPSKTVSEAKAANDEHKKRCNSVEKHKKFIDSIKSEKNEYKSSIDRINTKIKQANVEVDDLLSKIKNIDTALLHYNYVYKAYSDRRKIKSYMLDQYVPYLNERIKHYLDKFDLDLELEFTNALSIKTNYWGYEFFSGGERKRADVAMMLAMFDLHILMYGKQCNIMMFDEVDGRLDPPGVEAFADIIKNDLENKVDSILVISQHKDMRGALSSEIQVITDHRISEISEILI